MGKNINKVTIKGLNKSKWEEHKEEFFEKLLSLLDSIIVDSENDISIKDGVQVLTNDAFRSIRERLRKAGYENERTKAEKNRLNAEARKFRAEAEEIEIRNAIAKFKLFCATYKMLCVLNQDNETLSIIKESEVFIKELEQNRLVISDQNLLRQNFEDNSD